MADKTIYGVALVRDTTTTTCHGSVTGCSYEDNLTIECKTEEDAKELFAFLKRLVEKVTQHDKALKVK